VRVDDLSRDELVVAVLVLDAAIKRTSDVSKYALYGSKVRCSWVGHVPAENGHADCEIRTSVATGVQDAAKDFLKLTLDFRIWSLGACRVIDLVDVVKRGTALFDGIESLWEEALKDPLEVRLLVKLCALALLVGNLDSEVE
jgi:hypothetical protein